MSGPSTTSTDVEALFKLPLGEFTSARNALAARLKKAGRHDEADQAKALTKPSVSAWVVNQLYWRYRDSFDGLVEAGERLRRAQATGDPGREASHARREAVASLAGIAAGILRDGNFSATRDMLRRVSSTLEALSTYGSLPGAPTAGRLTEDVDPPGFEAAAALLPGRGAGRRAVAAPARQEPPSAGHATRSERGVNRSDAAARRREEQRLVAAAKAAVSDAQRTLGVVRKQAERAAAKLETAAARAQDADGQRAEIERRLARASKEAEAAREQARDAEARASEAMRAAADAERALERARRQLEELTDREHPARPR